VALDTPRPAEQEGQDQVEATLARVRRLPGKRERCGRSAPIAAARIALSLLRRRLGNPLTTVRLPGGSLIEADLRTPLGLALYRYGFCEPSAAVVRTTLQPGDVFIDGGANVGLLTLIAARCVGPGGRVIACEPAVGTMALLRSNVRLNGYCWVDLQQVALAERPGEMTLVSFEPGSGLSSFAPLDPATGQQEKVVARTLDSIAADQVVRMIKLDLEGAEVRALRGATRLLMTVRPEFIVEVEAQHLERQGASVAELDAFFADAGYEAFSMDDNGGLTQLAHEWWTRPSEDPNVFFRSRL
jgi:FkbM family methyltransferase